MSRLLSTQSVRQEDSFAFWREAVCESYVQLECDSEKPENFKGEILLNRLPSISTSFVTGSQQFVKRRRKDVGRANDESFLISLQLEKAGTISQQGREAHLRPGDFALYSSVDRYSLDLPDGFRQLVVQIPRDMLLARIPQADQLTAISVPGDSPFGAIVHDSVTRLISVVDQSGDTLKYSLQDTVVDLFVTGLASLKEMRFELSQPERQLLLRADAAIRANFHDPDFDRAALASTLGVSVRRLSEVFRADQRSISAAIRDMRLGRIADDLRDTRNARQSIGEIAFRWGIANQQSLVRGFQARYGESPRSFRTRHAAAVKPD
ncbi:helix-turn-helix domain-containing protein [Roseibium sp. MMSF_3544]|uniref:AraC-like ligand-binding domain-containing protein n=1 Tax=unclassified Roseibium TaxID=2629323 RepID=UPI00273D30C6|nr:helix-turn-helix domain-containing protein [Roseibium sp. MMSF_3544]